MNGMSPADNVPRAIDAMVHLLAERYRPLKVILFGSYAEDSPDEESDVDLFIVKETAARWLDRMVEVRRVLQGLHPGIPLDILVMTPAELKTRLDAGDQFIEDVLRRGKVLYEDA